MRATRLIGVFAVGFVVVLTADLVARSDDFSWNRAGAASYLDQRESWWLTWPTAARDHGTACVSCHTALPYAMSRPALRVVLAESAPSATERAMLGHIVKRVRMWKDVEPFYDDQTRGLPKTSESRGTESILNALILARYDAVAGTLSADTKLALDNMWALQFKGGATKGAWAWLNFHNAPWESDESHYWGTTLAAIAVGMAPGNYQATPAIQPNLTLLRGFLSSEFDKQPLHNRAFALWASAKLPGLLTESQQQSTIRDLIALQREDGGWSVSSLASWTARRDKTPFESNSDGYATGLVAFTLQQAGVPKVDNGLKRSLNWLVANQSKTGGSWTSYSLNRERDLTSDVGKFMSDAATAYAVLALTFDAPPLAPRPPPR